MLALLHDALLLARSIAHLGSGQLALSLQNYKQVYPLTHTYPPRVLVMSTANSIGGPMRASLS